MLFQSIILLLHLFTSGIANLVLLEGPSDMYGVLSQGISIQCRYSSQSNVSIIWYFNDEPITNTSEHKQTFENTNEIYSSLLTFQLYQHTEGNYYCNGSTSGKRIVSSKAKVCISFLEKNFIIEPQDKYVSIGDTVLFECVPPNGLPKPVLKWFKDNFTITLDERMQLSDSGALRIDRVLLKDTGLYMCQAESYIFQRSSSAARLNVRQRPYFVESPISQSVYVHGPFDLSCRVAGNPPPAILWRRESPSQLIPVSRTRLLSKGTLRFLHAQLEDSGDYICQAVGLSGVIEAAARVTVVVPPALIETSPTQLFVSEGDVIRLFCAAKGTPQPEVRWTRDAGRTYYLRDARSPSDHILVTSSGSLVITAVRYDDTGFYECIASSVIGRSRSVTELKVVPNPLLSPPVIGEISHNYFPFTICNYSTTVRLICSIASVFPSTEGRFKLLWYLNGTVFKPNLGDSTKLMQEAAGSLLIKNVHENDSGNYTCAVYDISVKRYTARTIRFVVNKGCVHPVVLPDNTYLPFPPTALVLVDKSDTWISVEWNDTDVDSDFIGYQAAYLMATVKIPQNLDHELLAATLNDRNSLSAAANLHRDDWFTSGQLTRQRRHKFTKLLPNTGYWLEVRKVNIHGFSRGAFLPFIVYTLKSAVGADVFAPHQFSVNTRPNILGARFAGEYHEIVSNFQSIQFEKIFVRSLTSTELSISWTVRPSALLASQLSGFIVSSKPVPITRCISAIASRTDADQDDRLLLAEFDKSTRETGHCSFSTDDLFGQLLRISPVLPIDMSNPLISSREIAVPLSSSSPFPTMRTVSGGHYPFTCYEVEVSAFRDDITYGRIWSRPSPTGLALTLDASPSSSPELVTVAWIAESVGFSSNSTMDIPITSSNAVRIAWKPLDIGRSHGALVAYMVHMLVNDSGQSRSFKVPPDQQTKDIYGLNPTKQYTIFLSGVTCRGEGVRGPAYHLEAALPYLVNENHWSERSSVLVTAIPTWIYGVIVAIVSLWILLGLGIPLIIRRRACSKSEFPFIHDRYCCCRCVIRDTTPDYLKGERGLSGAEPTTDTPSGKSVSQSHSRSDMELSNFLHQSSDASQQSYGKSVSSRNPSSNTSKGYHNSSNSQSPRNGQCGPRYSQTCDLLDANNATIYSNNALSYMGDRGIAQIPDDSDIRISGPYLRVQPNPDCVVARQHLPNSIDIPLPVPLSQLTDTSCRTLSFRDRVDLNPLGLDATEQVKLAMNLDDVVPPYASCTVLPGNHSDSFSELAYHPNVLPESVNKNIRRAPERQLDDCYTGMFQNTACNALPLNYRIHPAALSSHTSQSNGVHRLRFPDQAICAIPPPPTYPPPPLPAGSQGNAQVAHGGTRVPNLDCDCMDWNDCAGETRTETPHFNIPNDHFCTANREQFQSRSPTTTGFASASNMLEYRDRVHDSLSPSSTHSSSGQFSSGGSASRNEMADNPTSHAIKNRAFLRGLIRSENNIKKTQDHIMVHAMS